MVDNNMDLLARTLEAIGDLADDVVFVGGITTFLLLPTDAINVRNTVDVDLIVEGSVHQYYKAEQKLLSRKFQADPEVRCRYTKEDLIVDLMPIDPKILGFSNRWYQAGLENCQQIKVVNREIKILTITYFIATKIEAFLGRGNGDYYASKDMEDIITVLSERPSAIRELENSGGKVEEFIREKLTDFFKDDDFKQAINGNISHKAKVSAPQLLADLNAFLNG